MKKADYIIIVMVAALAGFFLYYNTQRALSVDSGENEVVIVVDSVEYGRYDLDTDQVVEVNHDDEYNKVVITDGYAYVEEANCQDLICVDMNAINLPGQSIICLPHKVVVKIEGNVESTEDEIDAIVQ